MPDPAALPAELFSFILECLTRDESTIPHILKLEQTLDRAANLRTCSLVNRAWHAQVTPQLYSAFQCTGDQHSFSRLWHFLRTVAEKPALGIFVQHLDLREWQFWINHRQRVDVDAREQRLRRQENRALFDIGCNIGYARHKLSKALRTELRHPFIVILIRCLPNVSTLYLSLDFFGLGEYDRFGSALKEPCMLPKLNNATFFGSPLDPSERATYPRFWIEDAEEIFSLPSLRKLALFDVEVSAMSSLIEKNACRMSPVTHLTIVPGVDPDFIDPEEKEILKSCLQLPRMLVSLTLHLPRHTFKGGNQLSPSYMIPNDQLWHILCSYKHSLEYLDLYDQDALESQSAFQRKAHLGLLSEFKHLRTLRIQPEVLLGGTNGILRGKYRLRDTLPEPLHALTLYSSQGLVADLDKQLVEVFSNPSLPKPSFLTLQDTSDGPTHLVSDHEVHCRIYRSTSSVQITAYFSS